MIDSQLRALFGIGLVGWRLDLEQNSPKEGIVLNLLTILGTFSVHGGEEVRVN